MSLFLPQNPGISGLEELTPAEESFVTNLAGLPYVQGDILYHNGSDLINLGIGMSGQSLTVNVGATAPEWSTLSTGISIGDTVTGGTSGSILFVDSSSNLAQDNANLFYDATNNRLGIGTATPSEFLHIKGISSGSVFLENTTAPTSGVTQPSPQLKMSGKIWNSAIGPVTMSGYIQLNEKIRNANPTASKISFFAGSDNGVPTEQMSISSNGVFLINGGADFNGSSLLDSNSLIIRNTATAISASNGAQPSNKIRLEGRSWDSAIGSLPTEGYIQLNNVKNNAHPTIEKIAFYVGGTLTTPTEQMSISSDGIFNILGGANFDGPILDDTNSVVVANTKLATNATPQPSNKLSVEGTSWNSALGSVANQAYLQLNTTINNANPFTTRLSFFTQVGQFAGAFTERMSIENTGKVGIGTITPTTLLEIEDGNATTILQISNTATNGDPALAFALSGNKTFTMGVDDGDGDSFKIGTTAIGTNTRFRIDSDGVIALPKASGFGIKVDTTTPTFGFADILGDQFTKNTGATKPTLTVYNGVISVWQFGVGDEAMISYHIPHDYVKGTDIFLHIHWSHTATTVTGGTLTFKVTSIYSKGHNQAAFTGTPAVGTFTGTASSTQYQQILSETQYSASTPSGIQIDTDLLEPDGVIEMTFEVDANNITVSSGAVPDPFIHFVDLHYQTTGLIGTKDKVPDFYT